MCCYTKTTAVISTLVVLTMAVTYRLRAPPLQPQLYSTRVRIRPADRPHAYWASCYKWVWYTFPLLTVSLTRQTPYSLAQPHCPGEPFRRTTSPEFVWLVARHGTRWPTSKRIKQLSDLDWLLQVRAGLSVAARASVRKSSRLRRNRAVYCRLLQICTVAFCERELALFQANEILLWLRHVQVKV